MIGGKLFNVPHCVYMLLCQDDGPIYVKVGMSIQPDQRALGIRTACPVPIRRVALIRVATERRARTIEKALHLAFRKWSCGGEWFRFETADKGQFNAAWKAAFAIHSTPTCKLKTWEQMPIASLCPPVSSSKLAFLKRLHCKRPLELVGR